MIRKRLAALAIILACATVTSCGTDRGVDASSAVGIEIVPTSPLIPARGVVDWVSYADHVVVVTVTAEKEAPADKERARGEGMLLREVTLSVGEALWSRAGVPAAPAEFQAYAAGWILREGTRTPFAAEGQPRLEVGSSYIVAMYHSKERGNAADDWMPFSVIPYQDHRIGHGEQAGGKPAADLVLTQVAEKPAAALAQLLAAATPDPVSTKFLHLDGAARFQATTQEKAKPLPTRP